MEKFLTEKNAVITGGTRGIGYAIAERLLEAGANVAVCGRSAANVDRAVKQLSARKEGKVFGQAADVGREQDAVEFFNAVDRELGGVDILVNNAGVGIFASVGDLTPAQWMEVVQTNLTGVFLCSNLALRRFVPQGGGWIVNISSLAGKNPFAGGAAYNASKFGLNGFAEAMMLDHRYDNVRVTTILPGSVDTDFSPRSARADWKIAPEDIAEVVLNVLHMPSRTLVSHVEMRPAKPPRKG